MTEVVTVTNYDHGKMLSWCSVDVECAIRLIADRVYNTRIVCTCLATVLFSCFSV